MFNKENFIKFIVEGPGAATTPKTKQKESDSALPDGFGGFDTDTEIESSEANDSSFAHNLLIASGFGNPEHIERSEVILNSDAAAKHLPDLVYYWPKNDDRSYQTLLFELEQSGTKILTTKLFKPIGKQQILEDALSRFVQHTLRGFEKGGEKRTASVRQGKQTETLCIVSVQDDRNKENGNTHLVCFGTKNATTDSLETFHIREEAKFWEPQIRNEHLNRLYERHFKKLTSDKWQNAFISMQERKLAHKLLDICINKQTTEHDIEQGVVALLEEIAGSYGLRRKGGKQGKRLKSFALPKDHDIGSNPESRKAKDGQNPFKGMTLRDESNHLLGYIIYCLDEKQDAKQLHSYLQKNNRFHNVLVIYPDGDHAELELWQGTTQLSGKLKKDGAQYKGEGDVVNLLSRFFVVSKSNIENPVELAEELAFRARYLRKLALRQLIEEKNGGKLRDLYQSFKKALIHDQTEEQFADSYAQTLTYGLLSARWISKTTFAGKKERFTREKALQYFPTTSTFLKDFFSIVLKATFEFKLTWLLEDIADLLDRIDINKVFEIVEDTELDSDPVIHFYEPFLSAYDVNLKKARGVYYTPKPVVSFIVRSVDKVLTEDFGLKDGLADITTWGQMTNTNFDLNIPKDIAKNEPFVQILDPATGTGTFLVEAIDLIYKKLRDKWQSQGIEENQVVDQWKKYVSKSLLPRFYGFEIMMASYVIAHMKIGLKLNETGYIFSSKDQVHIHLTNTLEDYNELEDQFDFEIKALSKEAKHVNKIKRSKRYTVVIGNPPYSGHSSNNNKWISSLLRKRLSDGADSYFQVDGKDLGERNPKWLNDDYVKFIRFSQNCLSLTGCGVLGFITNHGYLDNPTFRGMRQSLMKTFNKIKIVDLHGNLKKKEKCPDGSKDENVFDIQQGVSIGIFTSNKVKQKKTVCLYHIHCFGSRQYKYQNLITSKFSIGKKVVHPQKPNYFFFPQNTKLLEEYNKWFPINKCMPINSVGIVTGRDKKTIGFSYQEAIELAKNQSVSKAKITSILYRPFDYRYIVYDKKVVTRPRLNVMQHMLSKNNKGMIFMRQVALQDSYSHFGVSSTIVDNRAFYSNKGIMSLAPLYTYPVNSEHPKTLFDSIVDNTSSAYRSSNLDVKFIKNFSKFLNLKFIQNNHGDLKKTFGPEDIFAYMYAIFHSPSYRLKYAELLRIDFPRIPYTISMELFRSLCIYGEKIIALHLLETQEKKLSSFLVSGNNVVSSIQFKPLANMTTGNIWINKIQYFENVPIKVWNFQYGGYQICQKWLKGYKNRILSQDDILNFQKIIAVIYKTIKLMNKIDIIIDGHGGWPDAFKTKEGAN